MSAEQKQRLPSFSSVISVLSVVFYCVGFIRVELQMKEQKNRINALENVAEEVKPKSDDADLKIRNAPEIRNLHRHRRHLVSTRNVTKEKDTAETTIKISKHLLSQLTAHLCQSKSAMCSSGPPGPPGPPGTKGARGRRGQKGRTGNKGDRGIMGSPGKSGKQGMEGPVELMGEPGTKGERGDIGPAGMSGRKGEPGESISTPAVAVSPVTLTVNEGGTASFQCSASGNPEPVLMWSNLDNQSKISQSAVSGGELELKHVTGSDTGLYQCSATNILGDSRKVVRLTVNVHPRVSLHPGPYHVIEGSNVTLPTCHVTGYPAPVVTWRKSSGQLPQGRAQYNNTALQISNVRKVDSDAYFCSAVNLLGNVERKTLLVVVSLPVFTVKPPGKVFAFTGNTSTLNCSAIGDPRPVISWKRQGAALPVGRSHRRNDALVVSDLKEEDAGIYVCVVTSAEVFDIEAVSYVEVSASGKDCSELLKSGHTQSGVYYINPDGTGHFSVYCDMRTDGGGWTVFQRRQDGSVDFFRGWEDYKAGFGQLTAEFWLGNDKIHRLTASRPSSPRVELEDWNGGKAYAKYGKFKIGDEQAQYRLEVGSYSGTARDSLAYHNNMAFTTKDRDNDRIGGKCAVLATGAWWYNSCLYSNLNGKYLGDTTSSKGVNWFHWKGAFVSVKFSEMKLGPSS